jgi:hypothetical protein
MKKTITISKKPNTVEYIRLINGIFKLTDKEVLVLAKFMDYKENHPNYNVFASEFKKQIAEDLKLKDFNILNIYIGNLKKKKAIKNDKIQGYDFHKLFQRNPEEKGIEFVWN